MRARTIVVGVDGTPASDEALRWAVREASGTEATVVAVHAWEVPYSLALYTVAPGSSLDEVHLEATARKVLQDALTRAGTEPSGVTVEARLVRGRPDDVVLQAARGADLVVVGASRLGGLGRLLLGSVSRSVMAHAPCPVVIVHEPVAAPAA